MSKGLGQLQFLRRNYCVLKRERECACDIIENELKEHEQYKDFVQEICNYLGLDNLFPYNDLKEIEKQIKTIADNSHWFVVKQNQKKDKAFEIIRNKKVNVIILMGCDSVEEYNKHPLSWKKLTQEEFDLLKEVLNNEKETS